MRNSSSSRVRHQYAIHLYAMFLIALGVTGYFLPPESNWTALLPAILGGLVAATACAAQLGVVPRSASYAAAVVVAVLTLAGTAGALPTLPYAADGSAVVTLSAAVISRAHTALISFGFLLYLLRGWWFQRAGF